jgi:hypothetical protein
MADTATLEAEVKSENQLQIIVRESGLEQSKAQYILEKFQNYFEIAAQWEQKAKGIVVTDASQKAEMQMAKAGRLFLKEKRVTLEKARKELKEQSLREGKAIDGIANVLKAVIVPIEEYLEKQERFVEIQKEEAEAAHRAEVERRMEEERIAKEKAEAEERERIRLENERLKAEAIEREKQAQAERERQAKILAEQQAKAAAEKKAIEDKARKEREAAEAKARKEREVIEAAARIEREKQAKILAEQKAKADAERKKQEEVLRKAKEEAEKKRLAIEEKSRREREAQAKKLADEKAKREAEQRAAAEEKARLEKLLANQVECPKCHHKFQLERKGN